MDTLQFLLHGFGVAFQPMNLLYCFVGVPGRNIDRGITRHRTSSRCRSLTAYRILLKPCGSHHHAGRDKLWCDVRRIHHLHSRQRAREASSVVTCLDGYQMAMKGRAGPALGISAFGSFIAGNISIIGLMLFAPTWPGWPCVWAPRIFYVDGSVLDHGELHG